MASRRAPPLTTVSTARRYMQLCKRSVRVRIVDRDMPLQRGLDDGRERYSVRSMRERLLPDIFWRVPR